jgi:transcriptional regulator with XRE-family HTH domain
MSEGALRCNQRNRIAAMRQAVGLSQRALAARLGVTQATVARWELDMSHPSDRMVGRLAQVLRCRPRQLFPYDYV